MADSSFAVAIRRVPLASRQKVAFIGDYVAEELYGSAENAVGETIKINGDAYTVVGVAERQTEDAADFLDSHVYEVVEAERNE